MTWVHQEWLRCAMGLATGLVGAGLIFTRSRAWAVGYVVLLALSAVVVWAAKP